MSFLILPYQAAKKIVEKNPNRLNVISAEKTFPVDSKLCKHHLHLQFDDIDDWHIERWDKALKEKGIVYPEKKDILEAIKFEDKYTVHIIHCHAGISRSPAIGYAILRSLGKSKLDAMNEIMKIAPQSMPNKRIVRFADEIFG